MSQRKRPDRKEKYKERKTVSETVVKCTLRRLLQGDKSKAIQAINKRVWECSRRTHSASVALNLLVRKLFHGHDVKDVQVPEFWDQTFIRQLMLGVEDALQPNPDVVKLFKDHPNLVPQHGRSQGDRNIYSFAAIKFSTNVKNHMILNFPKVLKRYLYTKLTKESAVEALYIVNGWTGFKPDEKKPKDHDLIEGVVKELRDVLELEESDKIDKSWFKAKANLQKMMRLFVFVNRYLENVDEKLFNVLPISRIKAHYITIDTFGMKGILKETGYLGKKNNSLDTDLWNSFLDTSQLQGSNNTFTGTIDTDGLIVNIHFKRPKQQKEKDAEENVSLEGKRVLGVDPGRTNIMTVVEIDDNGRYKSKTLTRSRYYLDSGIIEARKKTIKWNKSVKNELTKLAGASPKSVILEKFKTFIATLEQVQKTLWDESFKIRWREQRFRLYGGKKRVIAKFLNTLNLDEETVLAFGSAKFAPGGKGEVSVPTTRMFKECSYRVRTIPISEFRTSKVYWKDDSVLDTVAKNCPNGKLETVRGLLWCSSTNEMNKFVNRDINAAINIMRCAKLPQRPRILDRSFATGKLNQRVGKILKC